MLLSGKDMQIISGSILMYENVPFHFAPWRELSKSESRLMQRTFDRAVEARETLYISEAGRRTSDEYLAMLNKNIEFSLNTEELKLLSEIMESIYLESEPDPLDLETHIGYGLDREDIINLSRRLEKYSK